MTVLDVLGRRAQYGTTPQLRHPDRGQRRRGAAVHPVRHVDGYVDTLGVATEGRVPLRDGTSDNPTEYIDAWGAMLFGATPDSELSISNVYGEDVVASLGKGAEAISRWGFGTDDALQEDLGD